MKKITIMLHDEDTNQPKQVETVENGVLDMSSPLQRALYVKTLNALSPGMTVTAMEYGDRVVIDLSATPEDSTMEIQTFEPEEEEDEETE